VRVLAGFASLPMTTALPSGTLLLMCTPTLDQPQSKKKKRKEKKKEKKKETSQQIRTNSAFIKQKLKTVSKNSASHSCNV
jgi:hypothetical protein